MNNTSSVRSTLPVGQVNICFDLSMNFLKSDMETWKYGILFNPLDMVILMWR